MVQSMFSGKNAAPVKPEQYLPFPDAFNDENKGPFSPKTARLLKLLIEKKALPPLLAAALQKIPQLNGRKSR